MSTFIPAPNAAELSKRSAAALRAVADLMEIMLPDLPPASQSAIEGVLSTGGRIGVELLTDRHAANVVSLVAIEREGVRRVVATVAAVGAHGAAH